jgi:hypothetical protein
MVAGSLQPKGHDDEHRLDLVLGEEIVEDGVGAHDGVPCDGGVTPAVEEIEDGVGLFGLRVVAGRGVDVIVALIGGHADSYFGGVGVMIDGAVGDGGDVPEHGCVAGDFDLCALESEVGSDVEVVGIEVGATVYVNSVGVDLRREWWRGGGPEAGGVLGHGERLGESVSGDDYFFRIGVEIAEGDGVVGVDLMRADGGLGVEGDREESRGERDRKGWAHGKSVNGVAGVGRR